MNHDHFQRKDAKTQRRKDEGKIALLCAFAPLRLCANPEVLQ